MFASAGVALSLVLAGC